MSITLARLKEIPEEHFYPIVQQMIHYIYHASPHEVKRIYHLFDQFPEGPPGRIFIETALNSRKKVLSKHALKQIKLDRILFVNLQNYRFLKNFTFFPRRKTGLNLRRNRRRIEKIKINIKRRINIKSQLTLMFTKLIKI